MQTSPQRIIGTKMPYAGRGLQPRPQRFIGTSISYAGRGLQPRPQRFIGTSIPQKLDPNRLQTGSRTTKIS